LNAASPGASWAVNRDAHLSHIEGMIFGDNPREGIVRGSSFLHPDLRFALEFPDGWEVTNGKEQVIAKMPGQNAFVLLELVDRPQGRTMEAIAAANMRGGLREVSGGTTTINGLEAYLGEYRGRIDQIGEIRMRAAHIRSGRNVYFVAGFAPEAMYADLERPISDSVRSLRAMSEAEAEGVKPNRIALYTSRTGDTWQSIAERQSGGIVMPTTLAIMNNHDVNDQPRPGERLKIVVGE
jgi:predicted Zn-dependent protease